MPRKNIINTPEYTTSICECGMPLPYKKSIYMSNGKYKCPKCGRLHYSDDAPIDWNTITKENAQHIISK